MNPLNRCLATLLVLVPLAGSGARNASAEATADSWKPYLEEKKGEKEFPAEVKALKDDKWLNVRYTEFAGYKPRLGVMTSEERRTQPQEYNNEWLRFFASREARPAGPAGIDNLESQVRQALNATNRFAMVERTSALDDIVGEQDFDASGRVEKKTAAAIGKIKGADYTVKVELVDLNPEKEAKSIGVAGGGLGARTLGVGSIGVSGKVAWARLNVRIIRTETSEVVGDFTVDGTAKGKGLGIGGGLLKGVGGGLVGGGAKFDSKKAASLSDAIQVAANKAAFFTAKRLEDLPWEGAVTGVKEGKVTINAGTNVGLKAGLTLALLEKGDEVTDPDTGEKLGFETTEIGAVRIVNAAERFATCEVVSGGGGAKRGDIVRLSKNAK